MKHPVANWIAADEWKAHLVNYILSNWVKTFGWDQLNDYL